MSTLHRLKVYFGMVPADELDDYDDYRYAEDVDDVPRRRAYVPERPPPHRPPRRPVLDDYDGRGYDGRGHYGRAEGYAAPVRGALAVDTAPPLREPVREPRQRHHPFAEEDGHPLARIVTLHPHTYNEARPIGERYREGTPVIMNLTEMDDADAKRLVDFAAGLAFALRGSIDKVTTKVFLLSPANVAVSAEDKRRIAEGGFFNQS
ncbi:MAG: cell division protein SepF [Pseudonocardiaceae bacterium]